MATLADIIDDMIEGEPFIPHAIAQRLVEEYEGEVADWLSLHQLAILTDYIRSRAARRRMTARQQAPAIAAGRAIAEGGEALRTLLDMHYDVEGTQIPLSQMGRNHLLLTAGSYRERGNAAFFEATFLEMVARKVTGNKVVGDVFTEESLAKMRGTVSQSFRTEVA